MQRILIVEDEPNIAELISYNLTVNGYQTLTAEDGTVGLAMARSGRPDLILLDIMLPGKNGYDICRQLRQEGNRTPVIMLTARNEENDKVLGLELGADDYISKPFGIRELLARVKAVLRRTAESGGLDQGGAQACGDEPRTRESLIQAGEGTVQVRENLTRTGGDAAQAQGSTTQTYGNAVQEDAAVEGTPGRGTPEGDTSRGGTPGREAAGPIAVRGLVIDQARHEVSLDGKRIRLTLKEFELLLALAQNRGLVLTRDQLMDKVWGFDYIGGTRTVDVHIRYLRRKLGDAEPEGKYIQTVRGLGYKMP